MRDRLYEIIFEADTPAGKAFDVVLLLAIVASVAAVMLESVEGIAKDYRAELGAFEWAFTLLFTAEYALRLWCVRRPFRYATSFFGIVDLLAVLPKYLSLIFVGSQSLAVVRVLRVIRVFRVFKLAHFLGEAHHLWASLRASLPKMVVFILVVCSLVIVAGVADVRGRGSRERLHEHPPRGLLGDRHRDHGWLRRRRPADPVGAVDGVGAHDHWLCDHRSALGHPSVGIRPASGQASHHAGVSRVPV